MKIRAGWFGFALLAAACSSESDKGGGRAEGADPAPDAGGEASVSTDGGTPACDALPEETGDATFDALMRDLDAWRREQGHTWLGVAIVEDGVATHRAMLGRASPDGCEPVTDRHVFHLHNATQALTDLAVIRSGKLDLDAPIQQYITELDYVAGTPEEWKDRVTVGGVLDRTGGFWPGYKVECERHDGYFERNQVPIGYEPGTAWSMSAHATVALGVALERVTGLRFEDAMKQELFDPLGLEDAIYEPLPEGTPYAEPTPGVPATVAGARCAESVAEYSALASLRDMHRWAEAVLRPELVDRIFFQDEGAFPVGGRRAATYLVSTDPEYGTLAIRPGAFPLGTNILVIPERRFAMVTAGAGPFGRAADVWKKVMAAYGIKPAPIDESLPTSRWTEYEGVYAELDGSNPMEVWYDPETERLYARDPGSTDPGLELTPGNERGGGDFINEKTKRQDIFTLPGYQGPFPHRLRFYRDVAGVPTRIVSWNGGLKTHYRQ